MRKSVRVSLNQLLFRRNYKMKKMALATASLGLLTCTMAGTGVFVEAAESHSVSSNTDLTLKPGSGEDAEPIVPDDTHDDHPETGDKGALTIPFASNITFGEHEVKQGDADYYALNKKPHVQVNDTRGGGMGWKLGVSISPFIGENGQALRGAKMILSGGKVVTKNNSLSLAPQLTSDVFTLNSEVQDIMIAEMRHGAGAFAAVFEGKDGQNENVKLHVPQNGFEAQRYTAKLTWVLSDAPA
jgi:hypothetical protein